jgi:glycosyltransferase involved in cell wall biosynthesis
MRFSLIVATLGRTDELRRLLESLAVQTHRDFEVIVVDQNPDDRVAQILTPIASQMRIQLLVAQPGVSRARNLGLKAVSGDVVAFPDDDCWYPSSLLEQVRNFLARQEACDGIICHSVDEAGAATLPWNDKTGPVSPAISWRRATTYSYFLRKNVVDMVGGFDETLGPGTGTPWGTGEDTDYMLRVLELGFSVHFDLAMIVHHPRMFLSWNNTARKKKYRYSLGDGHLLRKHPMPLWWKLAFFGVPLARMILATLKCAGDEVRFHWVTFTGRCHGYFRRLQD